MQANLVNQADRLARDDHDRRPTKEEVITNADQQNQEVENKNTSI
jgi:hypothetical protein